MVEGFPATSCGIDENPQIPLGLLLADIIGKCPRAESCLDEEIIIGYIGGYHTGHKNPGHELRAKGQICSSRRGRIISSAASGPFSGSLPSPHRQGFPFRPAPSCSL